MRKIIQQRIEKLKELNETEDSIARGYNRSLIRELQSILKESNEKRYRLYSVDVDEIGDINKITFEEVKGTARDFIEEESLAKVLRTFVKKINLDLISDMDYHILVDENKETIIEY